MKIGKTVLSIASVLTLGAVMIIPALRAGESDQLTKFQFTFSKPIAVPGQVLEPGTYWFTIKDGANAKNDQEKNIISIYNADRSKLVANVPARPAQRKNAGYGGKATPEMDGVELEFAPGGPNRPATLLKWFYPSAFTGHQFVYSDHEQDRINEESKQTVVLKAHKNTDDTFGANFDQ